MPPPVLLLDVMDTLVHDPFFDEVLTFFGRSLEDLFEVKDKYAWQRFELGETDEASLRDAYFVDRRPLDLHGLKSTMVSGYRWIEGIEPLLAELQAAGHEMHALSNYPHWWKMIEAKLELSRYVAWSFVSCETGVRKPDPEAYLGAAGALGVAPSDCLFVDDREKNCRGAEAVGMPAIQFESAARLRAALVEHGLL